MTQRKSRAARVGTVVKYSTKAGTRWRYQLWVPADPEDPNGPHKYAGKGGFATSEQADDAMQAARALLRAGVDLAAKVPTFSDYSTRWLDSRADLAAATLAGYRRIFAIHVNPSIGYLRLDGVTTTRLRKLYADLQMPDPSRQRAAGGLSKTSVHQVHVAVSAMLEAARDDHLIALNPARTKGVKAPTMKEVKRQQRERSGEMVTWSGSQLGAFLSWNRDTMHDEVHALWWVVAHTGVRRSEVLALRWGDIDLTAQRIQVRRALDTARPGEVKGTKSDRARVLDIDATTVRVLRQWKAERGALSLGFARADAYVFGTLDGSPRNPISTSQMFSRRVDKARQKLGSDALPAIGMHGLRHTHATILLENGENPKVVQERLGHSTITTTMDVYSHVTPTMQKAAVDRFSAAVSGAT